MKKDENSGVSIKQILFTTLFLTVATLGGLSAYRIVCNESVQTIQEIEHASLNNVGFEMALVENTEEDFIHSENIKFLAVKIINESGDISDFEDATTQNSLLASNDLKGLKSTNDNIITFGNNHNEKVISRGNYVREQVAETIIANTYEVDEPNKLLNAVVNEIKGLSEKQEAIIENLNSNLEEEIDTNSGDIQLDNSATEDTQLKNEELENVQTENMLAENMPSENIQSESVLTEKNNQENVQYEGVPSEYVKTIDVKATAYCLCKKCCGKSPSNPAYGITASGLKITPGIGMKVVASDPTVIPLGTEVYIEGLYGAKDYGYAIVADTGSAIKNLKIDLYMDTHQMALNWGVKNVRVYILDK